MIKNTSNANFVLLTFVAYIFSIVIRLIWVYQFNDYEPFKFHGEFMINTNDGYYWAEGARDILNGFHQENDLSPLDSSISNLSAFFVKILPFSFESIIFYMSVFLSSLIVIPLMFLGKSIGKIEVGFIASLLGSITWSYYNRTMAGYYDTDMLNIVLPTFLLWSLILFIQNKNEKYIIFTALEIIVYRWWYPQSYSLEFAFFGIILLYLAYLYVKNKELDREVFILLIFMLFAMMALPSLVRLTVVLGLFWMLITKRELFDKYIFYIFIISIVAFFISGGFNPILSQLKSYVFKDVVQTSSDDLKLHFFTVMQTIREANLIPFETFANRISGSEATFLISCIGYIWLIYKHKSFLLSLPMVGLGFLAYFGGLRFTIYAVPIFAFSVAFIIVRISEMINNKTIKHTIVVFFTIIALLPNINHVIAYKVPTVFLKDEVIVLDKLKQIASREDYVVSWWDYGYPIRYYSDVKTLIDGGKHSGNVNFPVSYILTNPQQKGAVLSKLDVFYAEKRFQIQKQNKNKPKNKRLKIPSSNIAWMSLDYGYKDVNDFLDNLSNITPPRQQRDVYLYLPNRMFSILSTISLFCDIDLMSGEQKPREFFYMTNYYQTKDYQIHLGNGISVMQDSGILKLQNQNIKITNFAVVEYDEKMKLHKQIQHIHDDGLVSVVFMKSYNKFLILSNRFYNSLFVQLFVFENYDKRLFEPVILNPYAKVYKIL